jgi:CheY-like chemotaxis protein
MEPALLSRLFDPFSQADQGIDRSKGGLGLGLALTKGLVELHGGSISARSEGLGRGSTFTLRVPMAQEAPRAARNGSAAAPAKGLRVVVIEDNADAAETLAELLALSGHEVEIAGDGRRGIDVARAVRPDVVICDIGLPGGLDGYDVARTLRAEPTVAPAFLLALSGYAQEEDRLRARQAGFDAHLAKPPALEKLEALLAAVPQHR